jgi:hypothetical protein
MFLLTNNETGVTDGGADRALHRGSNTAKLVTVSTTVLWNENSHISVTCLTKLL